jgi:hypothetical protein
MNVDFTDLEVLVHQAVDLSPKHALDVLASQVPHYQNAPLSEIFELLESAVETYTVLSGKLSPPLKERAEQEIEFFYSLTQERLGSLLGQPIFVTAWDSLAAA